ncbi:MAG: hypothetical protein NTX82_04515 [Candidatus Parcubacteria bacterium]|nr:hypothetical protein [Candidatus Parcubacteria bacterium]
MEQRFYFLVEKGSRVYADGISIVAKISIWQKLSIFFLEKVTIKFEGQGHDFKVVSTAIEGQDIYAAKVIGWVIESCELSAQQVSSFFQKDQSFKTGSAIFELKKEMFE